VVTLDIKDLTSKIWHQRFDIKDKSRLPSKLRFSGGSLRVKKRGDPGSPLRVNLQLTPLVLYVRLDPHLIHLELGCEIAWGSQYLMRDH